MEIGAAIFFTDYSITPTELAVALEERGFDSLWVAEHSHIPVSRRFTHPQGEAALTKEYFDVMDPFPFLGGKRPSGQSEIQEFALRRQLHPSGGPTERQGAPNSPRRD